MAERGRIFVACSTINICSANTKKTVLGDVLDSSKSFDGVVELAHKVLSHDSVFTGLTVLQSLFNRGESSTIALYVVGGLFAAQVAWWSLKILAKASKVPVEILENFEALREKFGYQKVDSARRNYCDSLELDIKNLNRDDSWRDDFFTDLEAEVEADGKYYQSWVHRKLGRYSDGRRKVRRLVDAIRSSAENRILLLGERGTGKSVALRHLALELAKGASRARKQFLVPIYINLRSMPPAPAGGVTVEFVRAFIRKEAGIRLDAALYVDEKWDEYIAGGNWFFILDSFDEIPDVLRASTGSAVIDQYAEAFRVFIENKPRCRAIISSREYKGPSRLSWDKFKILPLSVDRQIELISRSCDRDRREIERIRRHVASTDRQMYRYPMFLSLLCQTMRSNGVAPQSDYDLLRRHISQLIEFALRKTPENIPFSAGELLDAARRIAHALAFSREFGLLPTLDELTNYLCKNHREKKRMEGILASLEYVKVLRSDVRYPVQGDRRLTFAHRGYQEALVVEQIATGQLSVSRSELLTVPEWREYAVMLIESQPEDVVRPVLEAARQLVGALSTNVDKRSVSSELGGIVHFELEGSDFISLITLLQEALRFRPELRDDQLIAEIGDRLDEFWVSGDLINQHTVLTVSGLIPSDALEKRIREVSHEPYDRLKQVAFEKTAFLQHLSADLGAWLRKTLANSVLDARSSAELRRIEVSVSWMPSNSGATEVWKRCMSLYSTVNVIAAVGHPVDRMLRILRDFSRFIRLTHLPESADDEIVLRRQPFFQFAMLIGTVFVSMISLFVALNFRTSHHWILLGALMVAGLFLARCIVSYVFRAISVPLLSPRVLRLIVEWHTTNKKNYSKIARTFGIFVAAIAACLAGVIALIYAGQRWLGNFLLPMAVLYSLAFAVMILATITERVRARKSKRRFDRLLAEIARGGEKPLSLLRMARGMVEARLWAKYGAAKLFLVPEDRRIFASWLVEQTGGGDWRAGVPQKYLRRFAWEQVEVYLKTGGNGDTHPRPEITQFNEAKC
jgi:hypothetical protein